ncbi:Electron transfer flavoprotein alpha/beta-subunit [Solidesulfovibrio fructosivorans JJ]]|uniref:Electron transfer flavoprotein alpha/beta-subunit n=1 Tax=Solidesulfovibrio fructosivorans JJ] TaxID=596151 RepID=E1JVP7_SOLFR|nr:Electron transfer flavoprotein alpha/beta-subunit [Solidesulfovibrio fructosivorans]EFL51535.1 Electron transfer flavoprotein alpha/beta-subunit [Solidesulfovibrio fructosivorans JJ]]
MKTVIVYKWARDAKDAAVRNDGSVDWRNAKMSPGEDDFAALEAAKAIADGGEIIGLTIGDGDASWVLARGVKEAVSIADAPNLVDNAATAAVIAATVRKIGDVDIVTIGDSEEYAGVPAALAGLLGWPAVAHVDSAEAVDGRVRITRKLGKDVETVSLAAPAVVAVSAASPEKKVPGMKEQLMARKRPVSKLTLADIGAGGAEAVSSRATRLPETTAARLFEGAPPAAAAQLVEALRGEGVL